MRSEQASETGIQEWNLSRGLAYTYDGNRLAIAGDNGVMTLWELTTICDSRPIDGHTEFVASIEIRADDYTLATDSFDGSLRIWGHETTYFVTQPLLTTIR